MWFELETHQPKQARTFYAKVFSWTTRPFSMGDASYDMIYVGDTMIGGYSAPKTGQEPSRWVSYVSVQDVQRAAKMAANTGGTVIMAPFDMPCVGTMARIADPHGAELCLFTKATDDPIDQLVPSGHWLWNELHTPDPAGALAFYEKVVGFSHRTLDMGPAGSYHIIGKGGKDRGGVTIHMGGATHAHWLPYVCVDDPDATFRLVKDAGGVVLMGPEDVPGAGRLGVLKDPTGAELAVLKPMPASA